MDLKQSTTLINSGIESVRNGSTLLRVEIQRVALLIAIHAYKHGDYSAAQRLVDAIGQGMRGKSLVDWFVRYIGLIVEDNQFSGWSGKDHIRKNLNLAKKNPWHTCKPESAFAGYNLNEKLDSLIKSAERMQKRSMQDAYMGDDSKVVVDMDTLRKLKAIRAA